MTARSRLAFTALAAVALSAPTVEPLAMVADDINRDDAVSARGEYVALRAPEAPNPVDNDYPRNRTERRAAMRRGRR